MYFLISCQSRQANKKASRDDNDCSRCIGSVWKRPLPPIADAMAAIGLTILGGYVLIGALPSSDSCHAAGLALPCCRCAARFSRSAGTHTRGIAAEAASSWGKKARQTRGIFPSLTRVPTIRAGYESNNRVATYRTHTELLIARHRGDPAQRCTRQLIKLRARTFK